MNEKPKKNDKRDRGLYKPPGSRFWWYAVGRHGEMIRESTKTESKDEARRIRKAKLDEIAADRAGIKKFIPPVAQRVTVGELLDALEADYRLRNLRSLRNLLSHIKPVRAHFGDWRAVAVTPEAIDAYIETRRAKGRKNATINREVFQLHHALRLAQKRHHIPTVPDVRYLKEDNARKGFFEKDEFEAVVAKVPDYLVNVARFGYCTGWRLNEILSLEWSDVDREHGEIRLRPERSKNGHGRIVPLVDDLADLIERQYESRRVGDRIVNRVFHRHGEPIRDIRRAWRSAVKAAGLTGKLFHDLRRTAARNLIRSNVSETVAMQITGHRTRSMFSRYNITTTSDLRDALRRVQAHIAAIPVEPKVIALAGRRR